MTDEDRYTAAAHRVQTAIEFGVAPKAMEPKHMRVGIDMSKADMAGLARLLIEKGVFTLEECVAAMLAWGNSVYQMTNRPGWRGVFIVPAPEVAE